MAIYLGENKVSMNLQSVNGGGDSRYSLETISVQLSSVTIGGTVVNSMLGQLNDQAIGTIQISSNAYPYCLMLPEKIEGKARDFLARIEVLSSLSPMPAIYFIGNNESCDFEAEDDSWATLETGVNLFNFTETKRGN